MDQHLDRIRQLLQNNPILANFTAYSNGSEIHLNCMEGPFARLRPEPHPERWQMEFYLNRDRWRCYDFTGTIEECLELLCETPHYLFWEG